jgi:choline kinase
MKICSIGPERVTTAVLLAAGTGSRLYPLTEDAPKCLTLVNGVSILERLVDSLQSHGFKRLIVVTGFKAGHIRDFLKDRVGDIEIEYIHSPLYETTNNIFSLWMARDLINEPFLLLESDLVFDESLLEEMLYPDRIAISGLQPWMNGTCITVDDKQRVESFHLGNSCTPGQDKYKTVNIYSLSLNSWRRVAQQLDERIANRQVQDYYEVVFSDMVASGELSFDVVSFDHKVWYEIDTIDDLAIAEELFSPASYVAADTVRPANSESPKRKIARSLSRSAEILNATI